MRLTDFLGSHVIDAAGHKAGYVTDVRLAQDGPVLGEFGAAFRVHGLVVGRSMIGAHMGFERRNVRGPWMLERLFALIQGTPRYVQWGEIASIEQGTVRIALRFDDLPVAEPPR